jgi:hypothetical protein
MQSQKEAFNMKTMMRSTRSIAVVVAILTLLGVAGAAIASSPVLPRQSHAYGKSLTDWSETYWRWYYTGIKPTDIGRVKLMPLPASEQTGGSWTPEDPAYLKGTVEVSLRPGTPFVLPFFGWTAERYDPDLGIPDDPTIPNSQIQSMVTNLAGNGPPVVTLDGRRILKKKFWDYYVGPEPFDPIVVYAAPSSYGSIAALSFQGVTIVVAPLTPGTHTLHLLEKYVITGVPGIADVGLIYDNTWIIHVK